MFTDHLKYKIVNKTTHGTSSGNSCKVRIRDLKRKMLVKNTFSGLVLQSMNTEWNRKNEQVPVYFKMLWWNRNIKKLIFSCNGSMNIGFLDIVCMGIVKIQKSHVIRKTRIVQWWCENNATFAINAAIIANSIMPVKSSNNHT